MLLASQPVSQSASQPVSQSASQLIGPPSPTSSVESNNRDSSVHTVLTAVARRNRITKVLDKSVFNTDSKPKDLLEGDIPVYDPVLTSVVSSLRSRLPERNDAAWEEIKLPHPHLQTTFFQNNDICPHPFKAFLKRSNTDSPYTFVIMPGAYATWKRGSFNNQTTAVLEKRFNNPTIISFAGYLSSDFLKDACNGVPRDKVIMAYGFYLRLGHYLKSTHADPEYTGLIGFSGGGSLAVGILGLDAYHAKSGKNILIGTEDEGHSFKIPEQRVFGLGGAVFGPLLHTRHSFENLDNSVANIEHFRTLTTITFDWRELSHLYFLLSALFLNDFGLDWRDAIDYYTQDPQNFLERFFNESALSLKQTLSAVGEEATTESRVKPGYYNIYVENSLADEPYKTKEEKDHFYDNMTDMNMFFEQIDRPLLVSFAQDDPLVASYNGGAQPEVLTNILKSAGRNLHITVFNPKYGGHTGLLLDPVFEDLITAVFQKEDKTPLFQH